VSVLVTGMHRSGTSLVTRAVSLLGVPLCRPEDLLRGHAGNERGHWECAPLVNLNEQLLQRLASRWWCPPDTVAASADLALQPPHVEEARATLETAHPTSQWVWKDPRTSLLMGFWRVALTDPPVVVLAARHPAEVAESLRVRDSISPAFSVALWERHLRLAVEGAQGLPLLVVDYADLLADPVAGCLRLAAFLQDGGVPARVPPDFAGVRAFVTGTLRHTRATDGLDHPLPPDTVALWDAVRDLASGAGGREPVRLPGRGDDARALMQETRAGFGLDVEPPRPVGAAFVSSTGVRVLEPRPVAASRPRARVSVLLLPRGGAATDAQVRAVGPRLPPDAEVVTVTAADETRQRDGTDGPALTGDRFVEVHRERTLSLAERVDLAAEVAAGDVLVILAGPEVTPVPGWLPALRKVLEQPDCAVVCPAIHPEDGGLPAYGLQPSRLLLSTDWVTQAPGHEPFPVAAASVAALVATRRAFDSVGGFDTGLVGAGGEDVDFCLRLWRAGWRCLSVPAAGMRMTFETLPADEVDVLANTLRLGLVHLGAEALEEQLGLLCLVPGFAEALSRVNEGDAARRRRVVSALSWYDAATVPESLGVRLVGTGSA
jgi:hypothetical protein